MSDNIPPREPFEEAGDLPPEPAPEASPTSSRRAVRGSPAPSVGTVDSERDIVHRLEDIIADPLDASAPSAPNVRSVPPARPSIPSPSVSTASDEIPSTPTHPSDPAALQADPILLSTLLEQGFEDNIATLALLRTNNAGVAEAVNWIIERSNEGDYDEDSETDSEDMGVAQSAVQAVARGRTHKMILVVNTSLKMGTGKMAAQVGHATLAVYRAASATEEGKAALEAWRRYGEVKIVVKGESTEQLMELFKTARETGLYSYIVQDAGYTQIPPGSRTVLGVFGPVEVVDAVTGHLRLL